MEHTGNTSARASTDERAFPSTCADGEALARPPDEPQFATEAEAKAYWDGVSHGLRCATGEALREDDEPPAPLDPRVKAAEILDPCHRRPRQDGWLPWKKARFLSVLVAGGVVADACRAVGMSVASAYALRNRRSGRALAKMWDAVMIHRARARLADNNMSRAMNGCVEQVVKDGEIVAERRRFDNRLSMAMLTRLDRLAESKAGEEAELLRALSEDFEDYLDVVEAGGDEDAFVEARRPLPPDDDELEYEPDQIDELAALAGCHDWRDVHFSEVPVDGLDPERKSEWSHEDWVRAGRSLYLLWLDMMTKDGQALPPGPDCPAAYDRVRRDTVAAMAAEEEEEEEEEAPKSSPSLLGEGDHAEHGGGVLSESEEPLHRPAGGPPPQEILGRNESPWQASTSSTSPGPPPPDGGAES